MVEWSNISSGKEEKQPAIKASEVKQGEVLIGFIQSSKEYDSSYGTPLIYHLFVKAEIDKKGQVSHNEEVFSLRGTTQLNARLGDLKAGTLVRLECMGKQKSKKEGGKPYNLFKIDIAKSPSFVMPPKAPSTAEEEEDELETW